MSKRERADLVVFGGGPTGLATAIAARREGLSVVVLERSTMTEPRVGEHLPPHARPHFRRLGLDDILEADEHRRCAGVRSAWGSWQLVAKDYVFDPYGYGINLDRPSFDRSLAKRAQTLGACVWTASRAIAIEPCDRGWSLTVEGSKGCRPLEAGFLIDATGRAAALGKLMGAERQVFDKLIALVGRVSAGVSDPATLLLEASEKGWWYSAGLDGDQGVAMFMTDADTLKRDKRWRQKLWKSALEDAHNTASRCAAFSGLTDLDVRAAYTARLIPAAGPGWLAVGDACYSLDPLSSEGISKGLTWAPRAVRAAMDHAAGKSGALSSYCKEVKAAFVENLAMRYRVYSIERRWPEAAFWARRHRVPQALSRGRQPDRLRAIA